LVIQADGIRVAGVPIGSSEFVTGYVEPKGDDILRDLPKLDVVSDDLVHAHLMIFCQHPRFGFLGRNLPPAALAAREPDAALRCIRQSSRLSCVGAPPTSSKNGITI